MGTNFHRSFKKTCRDELLICDNESRLITTPTTLSYAKMALLRTQRALQCRSNGEGYHICMKRVY